jgi:DNA-binding CsgD family transcriptional regulator
MMYTMTVRSADGADVSDDLNDMTHLLGFEWFGFDIYGGKNGWNGMVMSSIDQGLMRSYNARNLHNFDPMVSIGGNAGEPYRFGSLSDIKALDGESLEMYEEARDYRVGECFTVPIVMPNKVALFWMSSLGDIEMDVSPGSTAYNAAVFLASRTLADHELSLARGRSLAEVQLSEQERVCLHWSGVGKTSWEIGKIIGRTEATINFHIANAVRKLGATNKTHAVVKALQSGSISY